MTDSYQITASGLSTLLGRLSENYRVLCLKHTGNQYSLEPWMPGHTLPLIGGARAVEPLKALLFKPREQLTSLDYGQGVEEDRPYCIVGVKACDLAALAILDWVFLTSGEGEDPFYKRARQNTLLISSDCTECLDTCFCTAMGGQPAPVCGFDLNLSEAEGLILVEPDSQRGSELIDRNSDLFGIAPAAAVSQRTENRTRMRHNVEANATASGLPQNRAWAEHFSESWESPVWQEEGLRCVECGACNSICPTCHCFLLFDQQQDRLFARFRAWDSCLLRDFARVAGGGNPRSRLWTRLRNRFFKKFDYFPKVLQSDACTGCGRCIEACPARIDIRQVLRRIVIHDSTGESVSSH